MDARNDPREGLAYVLAYPPSSGLSPGPGGSLVCTRVPSVLPLAASRCLVDDESQRALLTAPAPAFAAAPCAAAEALA